MDCHGRRRAILQRNFAACSGRGGGARPQRALARARAPCVAAPDPLLSLHAPRAPRTGRAGVAHTRRRAQRHRARRLARVRCERLCHHRRSDGDAPRRARPLPGGGDAGIVCAGGAIFADGGHTLLVRAISDIPKGGEVSVSYLADEQLYAPWAERRALLRDGHHFEAEEPAARAASERVSMGAPLATERWRTASGEAPTPATLATLERKFRAAAEAALRADAGGDDRSKRAAVEALRSLLDEIERALHPTHWIAQVRRGLVALGRSLDDPGLLSRFSLQLLMVREETPPSARRTSPRCTRRTRQSCLLGEGRVPPTRSTSCAVRPPPPGRRAPHPNHLLRATHPHRGGGPRGGGERGRR